jgi:V/A-type H+-transporting ATPase subunit D
LGPRFSLLDTPAKLDESALKIEVALTHAIKLAEIEASMREILDVISIKKRQINRIQYKILPQLDAAIRYIELILEETERQDAIRVRVLQRKRKERALKST